MPFGKYLSEKCGISPDQPLLAAVSGGADSLFLLRQLQLNGNPLTAAVFDHQLRQRSAAEAAFVMDLCQRWGIPCVCGTANVRAYAAANRVSIEEAARACRYAFLFSEAEKAGAAAVATGHHADDQVETVLMHLLRGSGLDGLAGMQPVTFNPVWSTRIPLIRPLLEVQRSEIDAWCAEQKIKPVQDESNLNNEYLRNRIRNVLLPELERDYNPQIRNSLLKTASVVADDIEFLEQETECCWQQVINNELSTANYLVFSKDLLTLPRALQNRLIRKAAFTLRPQARDFGYDAVQTVLSFFNQPEQTGRIHLPERLSAFQQDNCLILAAADALVNLKSLPQLPPSSPAVQLEIPSAVHFEGWSLHAELIPLQSKPADELIDAVRDVKWKALLDLDQIAFPLTIRKASAGDRFKPLGMAGKSQKLSDFWINRKIPQELRENYPILADKNEILWIPELQLADAARVTPLTTKVILLTFQRSQKE